MRVGDRVRTIDGEGVLVAIGYGNRTLTVVLDNPIKGHEREYYPIWTVQTVEQEEEELKSACPVCGGTLTVIGRLGNKTWFRCINCGIESSD